MGNGITENHNIKLPFNIAYQIIVAIITIASLFGSYKVLTHYTLRDIQENKLSIARVQDKQEEQDKEINGLKITMEGLTVQLQNINMNITDLKTIILRGKR